MVGSTRTLIPLLIIFFLFTACWSADSEVGNSTTSTSTIQRQLPSTVANDCPDHLRICLTPLTMRIAYGIDSLVQRGFTGKGQTIIDIVSFGSPTLQQNVNVFDQTLIFPNRVPVRTKTGGHRRPNWMWKSFTPLHQGQK